MANFNKVILLGNLTRDPEMRHTQQGTSVAKFGMAINRKFKDEETTCFVDLTAFGKQADAICKYLHKGKPIFVEGRLEYQSWQDREGKNRNKLEVIVEQFQFIGTAAKDEKNVQRDQAAPRQKPQPEPDATVWGGDIDDVPF